MKKWKKQLIRKLLLILMHLTGGQSMKNLEILSIKYNNSKKGKKKDMFVEDKMVMIVTQYHKNYMLSGNVKIIHQ